MKKMISLVLLLVMAIGLCACSAVEEPKYLYGTYEGTYTVEVYEDEEAAPGTVTEEAAPAEDGETEETTGEETAEEPVEETTGEETSEEETTEETSEEETAEEGTASSTTTKKKVTYSYDAKLTVNADKTATLIIGDDVYTMTWFPVEGNSDAIYLTNVTLNDVPFELVEIKGDSTQLKAVMTILEGEMWITISDYNFKDAVSISVSLKRVG